MKNYRLFARGEEIAKFSDPGECLRAAKSYTEVTGITSVMQVFNMRYGTWQDVAVYRKSRLHAKNEEIYCVH